MTKAQIIILTILFLFDFYMSIIEPTRKDDFKTPVIGMARMMFIWAILVGSVLTMNQLSDQVKGKCPEYQQVTEPLYKLKTP